MSRTLHLRDIKIVMEETGMSRERILELRAMPRPAGNAPFDLCADWMEANSLRPEVNARYAAALLGRLGPMTGHKRHDTGTGPINGIAGGLTVETIRSGHGPCQRCTEHGPLRLVGDRWLCERHARHQERRDTFARMVKAA